MSIIDELNLLKVISRDEVDINGLRERFIAFDENSTEILRGVLDRLLNMNFIRTEKIEGEELHLRTVITLTEQGHQYLNSRDDRYPHGIVKEFRK